MIVEFHGPWLTLITAVPLVAAGVIGTWRSTTWRWMGSSLIAGLTLGLATLAWIDLNLLGAWSASDAWELIGGTTESPLLIMDEFSAPLVTLAAALYCAVIFVTPRSKRARFPFGLTLVSLSILLAMFCTRDPVLIVGWMALQTVLPWVELRRRKQATGFFIGHQLLSIALIVVGWFVGYGQAPESVQGIWGVSLIAGGLLVRCGCVPVHCWMIDLFDRASLGTALLMVAPMAGAYGLVRMVLPVAPDSVLRGIALVSLVTAVYASGMILVQTSTRRFCCYLFLSNSSLLLIGLESLTPVGLTGSLSLWLSIGVALTSFGMIIRAIEGRVGRLTLNRFHGLYGQMPLLAGLFLLALLASIGFPGTIGFVGTELLIEGALDAYSFSGILVVLAMAINGIGALRAYFKLFTGTTAPATISMQPRMSERLTIWAFSMAMIVGGLYPQPGVMTRYRAVHELLKERAAHFEDRELADTAPSGNRGINKHGGKHAFTATQR